MSIADNVRYVREKIENAALNSGRNPSEITLVAVTKSSDAAGAAELLKCGITDMAENRVQMLKEKQAAIPNFTNWHLIGHLQTNKVKDAVGNVKLIQSLDSVHLAKEIDSVAGKKGIIQDCLMEINIFKDENKSGLMYEEIEKFFEETEQFQNIRIKGFMSMAPLEAEEAEIRKGFSKMYKIFVDNKTRKSHNVDIAYLSMGMSRDFEYAVSEGANIVRVGRRLFQ